ncbi:MAG: CPBP family intramembrane glutamic endopeptidase [Pseudomonadota bacterium]
MNENNALSLRLRWWHGVLFYLAALGVELMIVRLLSLLLGVLQALGVMGSTQAGSGTTMRSPLVLSLLVVAINTSLIILALVGTRRAGGFAALRLGSTSTATLVVASLGVIPAGIVADELTFALHTLAPSFFETGALGTFAQSISAMSATGFALTSVAVSVGPALGEEMFFRGLVLRSLAADMPAWAAVSVSALLFGVLHLDPLQGASATLIGIYLGYVAVVAGSIWPAVLAHAVNNLVYMMLTRLDGSGMGQPSSNGYHGYPPWLVGVGVALTAVVAWSLLRRKIGGTCLPDDTGLSRRRNPSSLTSA